MSSSGSRGLETRAVPIVTRAGERLTQPASGLEDAMDAIPTVTASAGLDSPGGTEMGKKRDAPSGREQVSRRGVRRRTKGGWLMRGTSSRGAWKQLDALFRFGTAGDLSDEELLGRFVARRDDGA